MNKLTIEFDFQKCKAKVMCDKIDATALHGEAGRAILSDITTSLEHLDVSDIDKFINLVIVQQTMLQFVTSASSLNTRLYEMQVKITDLLRDVKARETLGKLKDKQ